jgi:hypothetical protein
MILSVSLSFISAREAGLGQRLRRLGQLLPDPCKHRVNSFQPNRVTVYSIHQKIMMHNKAAHNPDQAKTTPLKSANFKIRSANRLPRWAETGLWIIGVLSWIFIAYQILHALAV